MQPYEDSFVLRGVRLRNDPARERCFTVAHLHSEMLLSDDSSLESQRDKLHREYNQEVLSLEIAAQTLLEFPDAPWELRLELARQCWDEGRHAALRLQRLRELGGHKGEFPILVQEWNVVCMIDSLLGRLTIQNRVFEAGSLDSMRVAIDWWRNIGDERTAAQMEGILADEVRHVAFANDWVKRLVALNPRGVMVIAAAMNHLAQVNSALAPLPGDVSVEGEPIFDLKRNIPPNMEDRQHAGFTSAEVDAVLRQETVEKGTKA